MEMLLDVERVRVPYEKGHRVSYLLFELPSCRQTRAIKNDLERRVPDREFCYEPALYC